MSDAPNKAIFLSYASQDAEAAKRICDALRAAGAEVWFDQNELVGGDVWDAKIRKQIAECGLFVPVISANTQARREGYFRIEWRLAAHRTHAMAEGTTFLLPVVIDATRDSEALVPAEFKEVQWTRLHLEEPLTDWAARVVRLLRNEPAGETKRDGPHTHAPQSLAAPRRKTKLFAVVACIVVAAAAFAVWRTTNSAAPKTPAAAPAAGDESLAKAWALLEDDPLMTRANVELAEQLALGALAKNPTDAEANAVAAWANFQFLLQNYDDSPQRVADLKKYADKAHLLAPDSIHADLALCAELIVAREFPEAARRLQSLIERDPRNLPALRVWAWALIWSKGAAWGAVSENADAVLDRLRAHSALGRAYADSFVAGVHWAKGEYADADRVASRVFASGQPVRTTYLVRLLVLIYGWGDLAAAREFAQTIPAKLLLEDVFITHVATLNIYSGDYDQALATLDRTPRDFLKEALVATPTALLRGEALAAAGRSASAVIQWQTALKLVDQKLATASDNMALREAKTELLLRLGQRAEAKQEFALLEEMEHAAPGTPRWGANYTIALQFGDSDGAIARLDRAIARDNPRWPNVYNHLRYEPELAPLREDSRVRPFLDRGARWLAELKTGAAAPSASAAPLADAKSLAVLAFDNRSDDKDAEYFSDGISEELINALGRVPGLTVRGRTSAFFFKGRNATAQEIAEKLGVAYLVRGSVRKAGGKIRITAQLSRAATDEVVWSSDPLERDLKDVFAVQDEIVALIAKNLSVQMGVNARAVHQVNPDALTALLQGRQQWSLRTAEGFARARDLFNRAVTLDPEWASAHAALASLEAIEASFRRGGGEEVQEQFVLASRAARRALELDPTLGEPHAALGKIAMENGRAAEAEQEFRRALALEPNNALVHDWHGDYAVTQGRLDLAISEYRRALELEPLSPYVLWDLAWELMNVRRYAEALALVDQAAALTPTSAPRHALRRARLLMELGRSAEAEVALLTYLQDPMSGSDPQFINEAVWCLRVIQSPAERERWTAKLLREYPDTYSTGVILLMLGQNEKAFPLLEKAPPIFWQQLYWEQMFDPVRDTPQFRRLLEKIGCAEEYKVARETQARLLAEARTKQ
jgi:TolB-like protein/Tfp pilus assembly protein PilF